MLNYHAYLLIARYWSIIDVLVRVYPTFKESAEEVLYEKDSLSVSMIITIHFAWNFYTAYLLLP